MFSQRLLIILLAAVLALSLPLSASAAKSFSWSYQFSAQFTTEIAIGPDNTVYVGAYNSSLDGTLFAFDPAGSIKWQKTVVGIRSITVTSDNVIICAKYDRTLVALNSAGNQLWQSDQMALYITDAPAVAPDGTIVVATGYYQSGTGYGRVYAFKPPAVAPVWQYPASDDYIGGLYNIAIDTSGNTFAAVEGGQLIKLDGNGNLLNSVDVDDGTDGYRNVSGMALSSSGYVYFGTYASEMVAVSPSFTVAWRGPAGYDHKQQAASLGTGNTLYMLNESQVGYILNSLTGAVLDSYSLAGWYQAGGIILGDDGKLFFAASEGGTDASRVYSVDPSTGLDWYFVTGDSGGLDLTSVNMSHDGALYVIDSTSGVLYLYKFTTTSTGPLDSDWPMLHQNPGHTGCAASGRYRSSSAGLVAVNSLLLLGEEFDGTCDLGTGDGCDSLCVEGGDMFIVRFDNDPDQYWLEAEIDDAAEAVASATVDKPGGGTVSMTYEMYRADEWFTDPNIYLGTDPSYPTTLPQTFYGTVQCKDGSKYRVKKTISTWMWAE